MTAVLRPSRSLLESGHIPSLDQLPPSVLRPEGSAIDRGFIQAIAALHTEKVMLRRYCWSIGV